MELMDIKKWSLFSEYRVEGLESVALEGSEVDTKLANFVSSPSIGSSSGVHHDPQGAGEKSYKINRWSYMRKNRQVSPSDVDSVGPLNMENWSLQLKELEQALIWAWFTLQFQEWEVASPASF